MDFPGLFAKCLLMYRGNVAVTFEGQHQTYAELGDRASRLANALADLGLAPGDRVAVLGDNNLEFIEQAVGIALAGMVRCPMYTQNVASTHAYMLNTVGARAIIVQDKYAADIESVRDQVPTLEHVIVMGGSGGPGQLLYEGMLAAGSPEFPHVTVPPDADHIIRFSAGTTGKPKGIVFSQAGWMAMGFENDLAYARFDESDAYLVAAPMSHASGLMIWPILAAGARYVIMSSFDPERFLQTIETERCTATLIVPTMIQMLASVPDAKSYDLSSMGSSATARRRSPRRCCERAWTCGATSCTSSSASPRCSAAACSPPPTTSPATPSASGASSARPAARRRLRSSPSATTTTTCCRSARPARSACTVPRR